MMEAIADLSIIRPVELLSVILHYEVLRLEEMLVLLGDLETQVKHPKLTFLILIAADYSYYDGAYRIRKQHSETGLEAYNKVKAFVGEYLNQL
jgi:hypothetical protein